MKNESPEKQLVNEIKNVSNILVTVSSSPSADQLASALALAIALDKLDKRTVAVFSGEFPSVINFLHPERTFETNADSLRDFIISLSKDKADRLRVKPRGDFVKVYITPYRSKITPQDIKFENGDFNIELIIAVGVSDRDELDASIASHGKIFHNATTATLNLDEETDRLGSISWQDNHLSSYAQMCMQIIDDLMDADHQLMDESIATALLTGVVSATDQFSNAETTPEIMNLSAKLMNLGANQQLVTSELSSDGESDHEDEPQREAELTAKEDKNRDKSEDKNNKNDNDDRKDRNDKKDPAKSDAPAKKRDRIVRPKARRKRYDSKNTLEIERDEPEDNSDDASQPSSNGERQMYDINIPPSDDGGNPIDNRLRQDAEVVNEQRGQAALNKAQKQLVRSSVPEAPTLDAANNSPYAGTGAVDDSQPYDRPPYNDIQSNNSRNYGSSSSNNGQYENGQNYGPNSADGGQYANSLPNNTYSSPNAQSPASQYLDYPQNTIPVSELPTAEELFNTPSSGAPENSNYGPSVSSYAPNNGGGLYQSMPTNGSMNGGIPPYPEQSNMGGQSFNQSIPSDQMNQPYYNDGYNGQSYQSGMNMGSNNYQSSAMQTPVMMGQNSQPLPPLDNPISGGGNIDQLPPPPPAPIPGSMPPGYDGQGN